jgi:hypothetical protein
MRHTYVLMGDPEYACAAWAHALDSYRNDLRVNPKARTQTPPGFPALGDCVNYPRAPQRCPKDGNSRADKRWRMP